MQLATLIPAGEPLLHERLDNARVLRLQHILAPQGLSILVVDRLKPWVVATMLSFPPDELVSTDPALDEVLQHRAIDNGIPVYGLETVDEQFGAMDGLPDAVAMAMLQQSIDYYDEMPQLFERMVTDYLDGRIGRLLSVHTAQWVGDDMAMMATLIDRLIDRRNDLMVERMGPRLAEGNALIAVGAAHLPGPSGILAQLAAKGFAVERVY